jgi:hypothetical protein
MQVERDARDVKRGTWKFGSEPTMPRVPVLTDRDTGDPRVSDLFRGPTTPEVRREKCRVCFNVRAWQNDGLADPGLHPSTGKK